MRLRSGKSVEETSPDQNATKEEVQISADAKDNAQNNGADGSARKAGSAESDTSPVSSITQNTHGTISQAATAAGLAAVTSGMSVAKKASKDIRPHDKNVVFFLKIGGSLLVTMYFLIPAIVKLNPWIMAEIAFCHRVRVPFFANLSKPEDQGLKGSTHFRIPTTDDLTLGAWHILPEHLQKENPISTRDFADLLKNGAPIMIYLHGNAGTRATDHRVRLYEVFAKAGFHTITVDYRGFGDSEGSPSEDGLVKDAMSAFNWVKSRCGETKVYIWGHSLGTGVATHATSKLCQRGTLPTGIILEAPFTNLIEETICHPLAAPFRYMPYFTWVFVESLKYNNIYFASDKHIQEVTVPILILHAKDDNIIPFHMGQKLYEVARAKEKEGAVQFVGFEAEHQYSHDNIYKAKDLMQIVKDFMAGRLHS